MKQCDNKSVGVLIKDDSNRILLIERKRFPFGFAPPAGHIDDFPSPEDCAVGEVEEEVGLKIESLKLVYKGRHENMCRREGGSHHYWYVYTATVSGEIKASEDEVLSYRWCSQDDLKALRERCGEYRQGNIPEDEWQKSPGLEPVWVDILDKIDI